MKLDIFKNRQVVLSTLLVSAIYNLFWVAVYIYLTTRFSGHLIYPTLIFLLFYLLVAQPVRDYIVSHVLLRSSYPDFFKESAKVDEEIKNIDTAAEVYHFLRRLTKHWETDQIHLVYKEDDGPHVTITRTETINRRELKAAESKVLHYLQYHESPVYIEEAPENLREIFLENNWYTVVPIFFRGRFRGVFAFEFRLARDQILRIQNLSRRSGLILENESMANKALKNKVFLKEFTLARQIEKFLITGKLSRCGNYIIQNLYNEKKSPFLVLWERVANHSAKVPGEYMILCKVSDSSKRARSIHLFSVQGYFMTYAKEASSLRRLLGWLNQSLQVESEGLYLSGFLIEFREGQKWRIAHFGNGLSIVINGKATPLEPIKPLGSEKSPTIKMRELKNFDSARFLIKGKPVMQLQADHEK